MNPNSEVSSHYVVYRDGGIEQWVDEKDGAWANGIVKNPTWNLYDGTNPNKYTISIEGDGFHDQEWTVEKYNSTLWLLRDIRSRHGFSYNNNTLIGHYRINSVDRPNCPGPFTPFDELILDLQDGV